MNQESCARRRAFCSKYVVSCFIICTITNFIHTKGLEHYKDSTDIKRVGCEPKINTKLAYAYVETDYLHGVTNIALTLAGNAPTTSATKQTSSHADEPHAATSSAPDICIQCTCYLSEID